MVVSCVASLSKVQVVFSSMMPEPSSEIWNSKETDPFFEEIDSEGSKPGIGNQKSTGIGGLLI